MVNLSDHPRLFLPSVRPELGKYYINRRGDIHGPVVYKGWPGLSHVESPHQWTVPSELDGWYDTGYLLPERGSGRKSYSDADLVEEIAKEDIPDGTFIFS